MRNLAWMEDGVNGVTGLGQTCKIEPDEGGSC